MLTGDALLAKVKELSHMERTNYEISKQIRIYNTEDEWGYVFTADEYGTVTVAYRENIKITLDNQTIHIPKDCIQHFIDALEQLK